MNSTLTSVKDGTPVALGIAMVVTYIVQVGADTTALYCGTGIAIAAMLKQGAVKITELVLAAKRGAQ